MKRLCVKCIKNLRFRSYEQIKSWGILCKILGGEFSRAERQFFPSLGGGILHRYGNWEGSKVSEFPRSASLFSLDIFYSLETSFSENHELPAFVSVNSKFHPHELDSCCSRSCRRLTCGVFYYIYGTSYHWIGLILRFQLRLPGVLESTGIAAGSTGRQQIVHWVIPKRLVWILETCSFSKIATFNEQIKK